MDDLYVGKSEKLILKNTQTLRTYIRDIMRERKDALNKDKTLANRKDFLTVLLTDDEYSVNEQLRVDECMTFFIAATQTTTVAVSNTLYYLTMHPEIRAKLLQEISVQMKGSQDMAEISVDEWQQSLSYDNLQEYWSYLMKVVQESLRLAPPVTITS